MSYTIASSVVSSAYPKWTISSSIDLTSATTTTVVNVAEAGILEQVSFQVTSGPTGVPAGYFKITSDGTVGDTIQIYNGAASWDQTTKMFIFSGTGATVDDRVTILLGIPYRTSLKVEFVLSAAASAGSAQVGVLRAKSN